MLIGQKTIVKCDFCENTQELNGEGMFEHGWGSLETLESGEQEQIYKDVCPNCLKRLSKPEPQTITVNISTMSGEEVLKYINNNQINFINEIHELINKKKSTPIK
jgi:hypothetical protein